MQMRALHAARSIEKKRLGQRAGKYCPFWTSLCERNLKVERVRIKIDLLGLGL